MVDAVAALLVEAVDLVDLFLLAPEPAVAAAAAAAVAAAAAAAMLT